VDRNPPARHIASHSRKNARPHICTHSIGGRRRYRSVVYFCAGNRQLEKPSLFGRAYFTSIITISSVNSSTNRRAHCPIVTCACRQRTIRIDLSIADRLTDSDSIQSSVVGTALTQFNFSCRVPTISWSCFSSRPAVCVCSHDICRTK